ncbi:hypothetical protein MBLNU459_g8431t1 [Dothideomycetes sp. NU459]
MLTRFFLPFVFFFPAHSLFILLPLYIYPGTSASAWSSVFSTVAAYPKVQWQIVINPDSGPGAGSLPDSNYIAGIAKLNHFPNVKTLGYVDTAFTKRPYNDVISDINVYANWTTYHKANISMAGIFFDDATDSTLSADHKYMHNVSSHAYATIPSAVTPVIFNPGTIGDTTYFNYCDTMIEFEDSMLDYKQQTTINMIPAAYRKKSAIIIHNTPATVNVKNLVHTIALNKIEGVYLTSDCCYNAINGTLLKKLAGAVAAVC